MGDADTATAGGDVADKKLENPYYYYGSRRNQKNKSKLLPQFQKPKPLLPSQRQALELQARTGVGKGKGLLSQLTDRPKSRQGGEQSSSSMAQQQQFNKPPSRPSSRQALLQQHHQQIPLEQSYQPQQQMVRVNTQKLYSLHMHYTSPSITCIMYELCL